MTDGRPGWERGGLGRWVAVEVYCRACSSRRPLGKVFQYDDGSRTLLMPVHWSRGLGPDFRDNKGPGKRGEFPLMAAATRELHCSSHGLIGALVTDDLVTRADTATPGHPSRFSL